MKAEFQVIVSAQALLAIEDILSESDFREKFAPDVLFPDGSLHYSSRTTCEEIREFLRWDRVSWTFGRSSPLYPSPFRMAIIYSKSYDSKLGEYWPGGGCPDRVPEAHDHVNPINVVVNFKKPLDASLHERYLQYLRFWARSVQDRGIAGEGPASLARDEVTFSQRWCWFEVEASQCGPHTLNWLILVHLNFGVDVWPVEYVCFNPAPPSDARVQYPLAQTQVTRHLWSGDNGPVVPQPEVDLTEEPKETFLWHFGGLVGVETPFPVQFSDDWDWWNEETEISIVFRNSLAKGEVRYLRRIVVGWLQLAHCGGFGGDGISRFDRPEFSSDCSLLRIRAAFEGADMDLCVRVLIDTLRTFHKDNTRIERVEIGGVDI